MAGYIGSKAAVVTPGAERIKTYAITSTTTVLTGLVYSPGFVHVFHNGVRLTNTTDYTATDGSTITLLTAAQNGDEVVVVSYATFQIADTVSASAGGTFQNAVSFSAGSASIPGISVTGDTNTGLFSPAADTVAVATAGAERLRVDSSGNVGIGVTPSAWTTALNMRVLDLSTTGSVGSDTSTTFLTRNGFYDGANWVYKTTGPIGHFAAPSNGQFEWYNAPSGTAGNTATLTQRMTLDASGRLTIPAQPAFMSCGNVGGVAYPVGPFALPFNTVQYNVGNHYNSSTYRFTAPVAGVYFLSTSFLQYPTASTDYVTLWLSVNGASYITSRPMARRQLPSQTSLQCSGLVYLSSGDYVEARLDGTGAYYTDTGHAHFSGYLLG